jgi:hypothetical protein
VHKKFKSIGGVGCRHSLLVYRSRLTELPAWLLIVYGAGALVYLLRISWDQPVLDIHGFRQAQTAITAYWLSKGAPWLMYHTPVFGAPWSVPFEFPLYQWLVALLSSALPLSVDQAGRLIGVMFLLGSVYVVYRLVLSILRSRTPALFAAGSILASPLVLFWSRAVMIESTALFFALLFVYATVAFHQAQKHRRLWASLMIVAAVLAALVKITTFFGFAIFVAFGLAVHAFRCRSRTAWSAFLPTLVVAAVAVLSALAALETWLVFADAAKSQTLLGASLTSANLASWNYGTVAQRLDPAFWGNVVFGRALVDGLGRPWLLWIAVLVLVYERRHLGWLLLLLIGYLVPYLAFANLHWVHNYYQYANVVFLSLILALALWLMARASVGGICAATLAVALVCAVSWTALREQFIPTILVDRSGDRVMELARLLRAETRADQAILVFGLDWSSELPYYAERRALMMPDWAPGEQVAGLANREAVFGDASLGALVACPNALAVNPATAQAYERVLDQYVVGLTRKTIAGCDVYLAGL